jgi:hypothetical protein
MHLVRVRVCCACSLLTSRANVFVLSLHMQMDAIEKLPGGEAAQRAAIISLVNYTDPGWVWVRGWAGAGTHAHDAITLALWLTSHEPGHSGGLLLS